MEINPFETEWREDWRNRKGNIVVMFFGNDVYSSDLCDEPHEYVLDRVTDLAIAELGNLLGPRIDKRIIFSDLTGEVLIAE
jgi:hypothetical protein